MLLGVCVLFNCKVEKKNSFIKSNFEKLII